MGKAKRVAAILAGLALTTAACGDDGGSAGGASTTTSSAPAATSTSTTPTTGADDEGCTEDRIGGELTFGVLAEARGLDPGVGGPRGTQSGTEMSAIYDTLMRYDPVSGEFEPHLAEALEPDAAYTTWTLTLRSGVRFGNGDPLTTAEVEASVARHLAEGTRSSMGGLASFIASMEIVDVRHMVFHLTDRWGGFPALLAGSVGMVIHPGTLEELGPEEFAANPAGAGAGPYEVVRYATGEEIVLEAKDDYWGGPVCIERLRFVQIAGAEGTYDAFRNGELDVAFLRDARAFARAEADGAQKFTALNNGGGMIMINNGARGVARPGADLRVRQAIAYALDVDQINERVNEGTGLASTAVLHPDSVLSTGLDGPPHDPDRARSLVEEVKQEKGWDGALHFLCNNAPESQELALAVQGMLDAVGFRVQLDNARTTADYSALITKDADYDIACHSLSVTDTDPWGRLFRRIGDGGSPSSQIGYVDADMDAALEAVKGAVTLQERRAAMAEVQEVWNETIPSALYQAVEEGVIWHDEVKGLAFNQDAMVMFGDAYLER